MKFTVITSKQDRPKPKIVHGIIHLKIFEFSNFQKFGRLDFDRKNDGEIALPECKFATFKIGRGLI